MRITVGYGDPARDQARKLLRLVPTRTTGTAGQNNHYGRPTNPKARPEMQRLATVAKAMPPHQTGQAAAKRIEAPPPPPPSKPRRQASKITAAVEKAESPQPLSEPKRRRCRAGESAAAAERDKAPRQRGGEKHDGARGGPVNTTGRTEDTAIGVICRSSPRNAGHCPVP